MPSTNGHVSKRAILYARVSGNEQAKKGYSLADQTDALRKWAVAEGYEVLEEIADEGWSGAYLERPGLDRVRDLVQEGSISVVAVLFRDRLARGVYAQLLKEEFAKRGAKLVALNAQLDESPEGDLQGGIRDQFAAYERAKIAERTRRGKLRKAREGKIVGGGPTPNFGFKYNASRDNYVVDEDTMWIIRRIFYMVGLEGRALHSVKRTLEARGVSTPAGNKRWHTRSIRTFILEDVYKPHRYEEIEPLVEPNVAARLNPNECYGIWWFNRERVIRRKVAEISSDGSRAYRQTTKTTTRPKAEWLAVPVPHSGIPREVVDAARRAIAHNKPPSSNGDRLWELSSGILRCRDCGFRMRTTTSSKASKTYYYYNCSKHHQDWAACPNRKTHRAEDLERQVWDLVYEAMTDPEQLRADLDRMIDVERQGLRQDPEQEVPVWLEKIAETDRMRTGYQEMAAKGLMNFEELGARLEELKRSRDVAVQELEAYRGRKERVEQMERDRDALLDYRGSMAPGVLEALTPEERHQFYKMGRLEMLADTDGSIKVSGPLVMSPEVCTSGSTP